MDKKFIDILSAKYPSLTRAEIEQACLLAELRTGEEHARLAFKMVNYACLMRLRKDRAFNQRLVSYDQFENPEEYGGIEETFIAEIEREEEWEEVLRNLPLPCRMLAEIAKDEARMFASRCSTDAIWTRKTLETIRERIKHRFIEWEWNHSRWAYYKARKRLLNAMHRHERKTRGRRKER